VSQEKQSELKPKPKLVFATFSFLDAFISGVEVRYTDRWVVECNSNQVKMKFKNEDVAVRPIGESFALKDVTFFGEENVFKKRMINRLIIKLERNDPDLDDREPNDQW